MYQNERRRMLTGDEVRKKKNHKMWVSDDVGEEGYKNLMCVVFYICPQAPYLI
ncbi:hypothetical protein EXN66_Car003421 [Channa argus]|uniref:Uncharacterized protein n=1 Tax=Channa argus TaxID=215402 RepID=A0A6G1PC12_CHAAH|nr:hypothetical protein EXN66_Car003421 [Channa argus]